MRDVKLVSLSEDGSHLVLTHEGTGEQFALAIDDRVRAAVVSDRARLGQLPLEMESRLRPKEIQARVRAGESSEVIAEAAGVPLERVLRYAGPVLAEREHVAALAMRCAVRRRGQDGPGAILQQLVESRIRAIDGQLDTLAWDAWRTEAGRWTVAAQYYAGSEQQLVTFDFDPADRIVVPADDHARSLLGEPTSDGPTSDGPTSSPRTRLTAVPAPVDNDPETDDGTPGSASADSEDTVDLSGLHPHARVSELAPDEVADLDDGSAGEERPPDSSAAAKRTSAQPATQADETGAPDAEQAARRGGNNRKRRSKRAVVPSWDEILFGASDSGSSS